MGRAVDFIGLGAQRSGTSWLYACLYDHPQVCMPFKEVHFFSREANWSKGREWYEGIFEACSSEQLVGEYSTSYLCHELAPERIDQSYPGAKLLVSIRNPADRAYSNYMNDVMSGKVQARQSFSEALESHPEYVEHGRYASQLERYLRYFARDQMLIMVYEDALRDPGAFLKRIYQFLQVDSMFASSMLGTRINESRVPRSVRIDRLLLRTSEMLLRQRHHKFWWFLKKGGLGRRVRSLNTTVGRGRNRDLDRVTRLAIYESLQKEIRGVENILGRQLEEWQP